MLLLSLLQAWVAAAVVIGPANRILLLILVCSNVFFAILVASVIQASWGNLLVVIEKPMPVDETVTDPPYRCRRRRRRHSCSSARC